jgi:hypothetical protein
MSYTLIIVVQQTKGEIKMNEAKILDEMIAEADETREHGKYYSASFKDVDGVGRVACYRDYGVRKNGYFAKVARTNWKLNGKVISLAKLQNQLNG